jgi:hypothetical protein
MVSVRPERPQVPTLWIDTFVGLGLAQKNPASRLQRLKDIAWQLVRHGKLLCPQADQEEEYQGTQLYERTFSEFEPLSLGIWFRHRAGIADQHIALAMGAFVAKAQDFTLPLQTFFHDDPVKQLANAQGKPFFVTVRMAALEEIQECWKRGKKKTRTARRTPKASSY